MVGLAKSGGDMPTGCDAWMWKSLSFRCPGEGFGLHFGRLLVTLGSLCQVFFRVPERGWNFDGHLRDQIWILVDF